MSEIRRFVRIDDYKRALYMAAREKLQRDFDHLGYAFICVKLKSIVRQDSRPGESYWCDFIQGIEEDFNNMFPEFIELFDGYSYTSEGWSPTDVRDAWFATDMIEARIALIDFILTQ